MLPAQAIGEPGALDQQRDLQPSGQGWNPSQKASSRYVVTLMLATTEEKLQYCCNPFHIWLTECYLPFAHILA